MKLLATLSAGLLFLILGVATVVHSQEPKAGAEPGESRPPAATVHHQAAAPAPRPQAAPPKTEPHPQATPPHAEPHPQAEHATHPAAPVSHQEKLPAAEPKQEPAVHSAAPNPHEARPAQQHEHHEAAPSEQAARPPEPQNRAATPQPAPAPRPPHAARPAAEAPQNAEQRRPGEEPPHTAQQRHPAPTPEQQRDWDRHRADNWQAEHHTWQDRGGYRGYRIPQQHYQAYFGPPHVFRIYENPVAFYHGYPRFQYGNYWVQVVDPWPNYWGSDWFYTDPVYVAYLNDGYYLIDTLHPDVPLAVEIFG